MPKLFTSSISSFRDATVGNYVNDFSGHEQLNDLLKYAVSLKLSMRSEQIRYISLPITGALT